MIMTVVIDEWNRISLDQLIATIQSGSRPKGGVSAESGDIPSLGGENLTLSGGVKLNDVKLVPSEFYKRMSKGHLEKDDVLINKDGAQTGKVGFYEVDLSLACINEHLFLLRGQKSSITQKYLYYFLLSQPGQYQIRSQISGSAQPGLKSNFIRGLIVDVPRSLTEQNKIAHILSTVDRVIEQTEALIAKQQSIKSGLMQDLLTRGIDEQGNLRSEKTHQFKDSLIGRIPVEWQSVLLGNVSKISSGLTLGKNLSGEGTIELPYLRVANVQDGYLDLSDVKCIRVKKSDVSKFQLHFGDVLMNEGGDYDKLGRGTMWRGEIETCLHQNHIFKVRPISLYLSSEFLAIISASEYGKKFFLISSKQSTNLASINSTQLKSFPIPLPSYNEQLKIVFFINQVDKQYESITTQLRKLRALKTALMQDLLTGRKRVTALLQEKEMVNI